MRKEFGKVANGDNTYVYTLTNGNGMSMQLTDLGATIVSIVVKDKNGNDKDVVLGYDTAEEYEHSDTFFGAMVGRYANRISKGMISINGKEYHLGINDNKNTLHSGMDFFKDRIWNVKEQDDSHISFALFSSDKDQGFPGNANITVEYTLTDENEVKIQYGADTDQDTVFNFTNHSYFNLNGHDAGDVLDHTVWIEADYFLPADEENIPTGEICAVDDTPMDFRCEKKLGKDIDASYPELIFGQGYDRNWVLAGEGFRKVAGLKCEASGILMEVFTDLPGMQLYTANYLNDVHGKNGAIYEKRSAVCMETQYFPNAINEEKFAIPIVKAGESYSTTTIYRFHVL